MEARRAFFEAELLFTAPGEKLEQVWSQIWAAHQRFFKFLCIAAKVDECIKIAKDAVHNGKCVVIGLQSTGDAQAQAELERNTNVNGFVSTAR